MPYESKKYKERKRRKEFGHLLRQTRAEKNLSKEAAAMYLGISIETLERIEQGSVSPDIPNLSRKVDKLKDREKMLIAL